MSKQFKYDALVIRTSDKDGKSSNDFQYPVEVGAIVECPDWDPAPRCGGGLHGLLDGEGEWGLLSPRHDALWWVIGVKRSECVVIDEEKVKFRKGQIVYVGGINGALKIMAGETRKLIAKSVVATTGDRAHSSTTGDRAHSSTTGDSAHSSTTGDRAHSSTTGKNSVAVSLGYAARAKAAVGGAICLAHIDDNGDLVAIRASLVGKNGIKPGVEYELTASGKFKQATD